MNGVRTDEYFMERALREAYNAYSQEEIPIGAVIVTADRLIAKAHNSVEKLNDVTAHAEILAITSASYYLGSKYLTGCTMYVTLEPCPMCAGAIYWAQIKRLVFGSVDDKMGYSKFSPAIFNGKVQVSQGILEQDCSELVRSFFQTKR